MFLVALCHPETGALCPPKDLRHHKTVSLQPPPIRTLSSRGDGFSSPKDPYRHPGPGFLTTDH
jgi:hypothetical protein